MVGIQKIYVIQVLALDCPILPRWPRPQIFHFPKVAHTLGLPSLERGCCEAASASSPSSCLSGSASNVQAYEIPVMEDELRGPPGDPLPSSPWCPLPLHVPRGSPGILS